MQNNKPQIMFPKSIRSKSPALSQLEGQEGGEMLSLGKK
jgi:hypothetical protein